MFTVQKTTITHRRKPLIMVVDDQRLIRAMIRDQLITNGYDVVEVGDGKLALTEFCKTLPDVVLMDIYMPNLDGCDAVACLRQLPSGAKTPIIMITAMNDEDSISRAFRSGADEYISKPINLTVLTYRIRRLIQAEKNRKLIEELATTDELTGLLNRRMLIEHLTDTVKKRYKVKNHFGLFMIDIDFFKKINDNYGHQFGDEVLAVFSEILKQKYKDTEYAGRYGGEEFIFCIPDSSISHIKSLAEDIRRSVEEYRFFPPKQTKPITVTVSIGAYAGKVESRQSVADLIKQIDAAVYFAKKKGRNTVVWAAETPNPSDFQMLAEH